MVIAASFIAFLSLSLSLSLTLSLSHSLSLFAVRSHAILTVVSRLVYRIKSPDGVDNTYKRSGPFSLFRYERHRNLRYVASPLTLAIIIHVHAGFGGSIRVSSVKQS
eukprot:sb/3477648/